MGSPLAPVLAKLFMGHHENIWLEQYGDSEVLFYRRYVGDTFCLFYSEQNAILFFNYINNQHPNMHFTVERETDHVLPFLDVLIKNTDPHLSVTTVYRKKLSQVCLSVIWVSPLYLQIGVNQGVDKTRNMEHSGTFRNIPEHEKIKVIFMEKKNKMIIIT